MYVDDVLAGAKREILTELFKVLKETWVCSPEEYVTQEKVMKFCGYDIRARSDGGFDISQEGYLKDILERRGVQGWEQAPAHKIIEGEDKPWDGRALKEAQSITGEVQWLANRTRPDVAYIAGLMARMLHRRPRYVVEIGNHLLKYLNGSVKRGLSYRPLSARGEERPWEDRNDLGIMKVFSDASFAPPREQYRSVQGLLVEHGRNAILWSSSRQAFIGQTTAEAELLSYNESYQAGESVGALLEIFGYATEKQLLGDNKAALALCTGETGPWRTRHLRLRAAKLREAVQEGGSWSANHLRGDQLVADGLTKSLQGQAHERFVGQLNMAPAVQVKVLKGIRSSTPGEPVVRTSCGARKLLAAKALAVTSVALVATGNQALEAWLDFVLCCLGRDKRRHKSNQNQPKRLQEREVIAHQRPKMASRATAEPHVSRRPEK